jgi:LysM repeat protein
MFLYPTSSSRRAFPQCAGATLLLALSLGLAGCSLMRHHDDAAAPEAADSAAPPAPATAPAAEPETVTSNLPDLPADGQATTVVTETTAPISASAPKSYVVQRGDTLWGLATKFLKDPWLWPEIWYVNPEVSNPHRIYPGDTLRLAVGKDGKEQVQVVRSSGSATRLEPMLRTTELEAPIANIPYSTIAAFLSRPGVLSKQQVEAAPYVLALRDRHLIAGSENEIYVRKLEGAAVGEHFNVMHVGDKLHDPDGGKMLGYLANYAGTAVVTRAGNPASALITDSEREIVAGDVLVPETGGRVGDIVPHVPAGEVHARVVSVVNGVLLAGQYQVIAINRGSQQGIEPGHVLRVNESGDQVLDHCATVTGLGTCTGHKVKLPQESAGTVLMFRIFDHVSYGLVLAETNPIATGDQVIRP